MERKVVDVQHTVEGRTYGHDGVEYQKVKRRSDIATYAGGFVAGLCLVGPGLVSLPVALAAGATLQCLRVDNDKRRRERLSRNR